MLRIPRTPISFSKRLVSSYILDWVILIIFGAISYGFSVATPHFHAFSLVDLTISQPFVDELITTPDLVLASIIGPAVIIFVVAWVAVPSPFSLKHVSWWSLLRRKGWEWNAGWLGLALSEATALLLTQGMKNIFGKPRPDMLSRCMPSTDIAAHTVGYYAHGLNPDWALVDQTICTQTDPAILNDGFRSFPSGHSSTAFAGLFYLALYLAAKFRVVFPFLPVQTLSSENGHSYESLDMKEGSSSKSHTTGITKRAYGQHDSERHQTFNNLREEAASAPVYLLFLVYIPLGVAIFISGSRFFDYRHHGFDVLVGSLIGIATSIFAFRWYHLPLMRGNGWSWGPRAPHRAFGVGVGANGYHPEKPIDVEMGAVNGDLRPSSEEFIDARTRTAADADHQSSST